MEYKNKLIRFAQNRVWRSYSGGRVLDQINNESVPVDSHFPEDWIASVTKAVNPGRETISEGQSTAIIGDRSLDFAELLDQDPEYFLGKEHFSRFGPNPMVLIKFLDSSIRLHFQAHPTREFAQKHLDSNSGKAEAYYILQVREEIDDPYIYLGFQTPPTKETLKEIIVEQDINRLKTCFEKIKVSPGECYFIPGGMPHAIGEGILMIEIMEPSDWAVRFEFERAGYTLPEEARYMKRDLDFCLDVFDYSEKSVETVATQNKKTPQLLTTYADGSVKESLIDNKTTDRYRVCRTKVISNIIKSESDFYVGVISAGSCTIKLDEEILVLNKYDKFFCPAGIENITIETDDGVEIIECYPPLTN